MRKKKRTLRLAAMLTACVLLAGCGKEAYLDNLYNASSELFSSDYNTAELYNYYEQECFVLDGQRMTYTDSDRYTYRLGIDVSEHNGAVDWKKVKKDGYEFAFLRIGYRGYGENGTLAVDPYFEENYENAKKAGLDIGVYFFTQAVDEAEAEEEAQFVLDILDGRTLQLPVVYDVESIDEDEARTDAVSGDQVTANIKAFSLKMVDGGYDPMLYTNLTWETFILNMRALYDLPVWFSGYEEKPSTTYSFDIWQYSNTGAVDGIEGNVDLNIQLIPVEGSEADPTASQSE